MGIFGTHLQFPSEIICAPYPMYALQKFPRIFRSVLKNTHGEKRYPLGLFLIISFLFFTLPGVTKAAVVINEVAWMGTGTSANDEWIELYNDGSASVDITGWKIADGLNFEVVLAGSIASGQYAVIERTDDTSAPGEAFMVYVGVLPNTGATLSLYSDTASLVDRVVGGEGWENIGGDNGTKETAQYTTMGWITAVGTPGRVNAQQNSVSEEDEDTSVDDTADEELNEKSNESESISLYKVPRALKTTILAPKTVYVQQEIEYSVTSSGLADSILSSLTHDWNFGDFNTDKTEEVRHRYAYPGQYVITAHSVYGEYEAYARKTITVLPVSFSLSTNSFGDVQIHNDARYEIDVSGYTIAAGTQTLVFPDGTILLPNATITIPKKQLSYVAQIPVVLSDDVGSTLALHVDDQEREVQKDEEVFIATPSQSVDTSSPIIKTAYIVPAEDTFSFATEQEPEELPVEAQQSQKEEEVVPIAPQAAAAIEASGTIPKNSLPYLGLLAIIGIGILVVVATSVKDRDVT